MMLWSVWLEPAVKKHANERPLQALRLTEEAEAAVTLCIEEVEMAVSFQSWATSTARKTVW